MLATIGKICLLGIRGRVSNGSAFLFGNCELHTLIHTFAILNYPPHFVPDSLVAKCELRDVISTFAPVEPCRHISLGGLAILW